MITKYSCGCEVSGGLFPHPEKCPIHPEQCDIIASLQERVKVLEEAIQKHRYNLWGKGSVGHSEDRDLYTVLTKKREEKG